MNIGVIIVTYNRLNMLKKSLAIFDKNSQNVQYILVVNNASTDGTREYLADWKLKSKKHLVINNKTNKGGSGGFHDGLEEALKLDAGWIWVSDDDAFPEDNTLKVLGDFIDAHKSENIAAVCAGVMNHGEWDLMHRHTVTYTGLHLLSVDYEKHCPKEEYAKPYFPIDTFSYVGAVISKEALQQAGLTRKDFFIYFDDTEHSLRLRKTGKIYCVPAARVHHDSQAASSGKGSYWKTYYGTRNRIITYHELLPAGAYTSLIACDIIEVLRRIIKFKNWSVTKMMVTALLDGIQDRAGVHAVYKPGWKPKSIISRHRRGN